MKDLEDWAAVQRVYKQTHSKRETAKILGISRNTVKKLLALDGPPTYHRTDYHTMIDPYKEQIIIWRCEPYCFNGTRIFRELKKLGYGGSIGPVYRFLRRVDEDVGGISKRATTRQENPCGDQAQFDWSEYNIVVDSRYRKVYCFSMVLAASRKKAVCFSLKVDAEAIYEAIQELFDDLGGVTLELLIDNPKALVIENDPKSEDEIRYNPEALMLARHLGTELNACPCYWPRKKGKVERPFDYIEQQFIKGNEFASMEDLNHRGKEFINEWCDQVHTTTKRIPNQHYLLEEKAALLPLPDRHYYVSSAKERTVSADSYVSINGNKYSVPVKYATRKVSFRISYGFRIELYDAKGILFQTVEAFCEKGRTRTDPGHYKEIAKKVSTSIPQIRRDFTERFRNGKRYLDAAGRKFDQPTHYARKIMELQDLYDDNVLDHFIGIAVDNDRMDFSSFRAMLKEYNSSGHLPDSFQEPNGDVGVKALTRDCSYYEECLKEAVP